MTLRSGMKLGPYEIVAPLGAGGMGEVYRARDTKLGRDVAVKVLASSLSADADRLHRFQQEACAAGALNHPNILVIHHIDTHDGSPYIVSELLDGETLRRRMRGAPLAQRRVIDYASQIARGLAAAHEKGIVHRDLKPDNVFITKDGRIKILDFGLAKLTQADGSHSQSEIPTRRVDTDPGVVMGTAGYMSPEQVKGRPVDHRSDIFSFGAIVYEMLSGRRAFRGESAAETMSAILKDDPPDLSDTNQNVSPALERLVNRCLEKNPQSRFHSASDLAFALQALSGSYEQLVTSRVPRSSISVTRWERPAWIALAVILLLGLIASIYFRAATPPSETAVTRFLISPPEQTNFGPSSISPDGRRLLLRVVESSGRSSLWLRPLDSIEAQPLNGTEDASVGVFWSPDSRFIGFFSDGKLKKIEATGGAPQTLCDAPDPHGGAWNRDGTILFSHGINEPLYRVSAAGGLPTAVTKLDQSRQETSHQFPYFLPDGNHFLYLAVTARREDTGVYVGALDSPEKKRLVDSQVNVAYAPPGYLLFVRDQTLMAQHFDPAKLEMSGDPKPIVEQIAVRSRGVGAFAVSDNGVLAYLAGGRKSQLSWFDRTGKTLGALGPPAYYGNLSLSPDGTRVAVAMINPQANTGDIWIVDSVRSTRFTFDAANALLPIWSAVGSNIIFASDQNGVGNLYEKSTSGAGSEVEILNNKEQKFPTDWSRDGRYVVFTTGSRDTNFDIWFIPLDGDRKPIPLLQSPFNEDDGRFSPDGHFFAYDSDESGKKEVYVQTFPPSTAKWQISSGGGDSPIWRRDGKELFYIAPGRKFMAVDVTLKNNSFQAGVPRMLFQTRILGAPGPRNAYDVSPDGQRFLINSIPAETAATPITVVTNWNADLKR